MVQHTEMGNDVSAWLAHGGPGFWGKIHAPLSWPCSVGVRNSFPSLCRMPVGFFPLPLKVKS